MSNKTEFLIPNDGLKVRDPQTGKPLEKEGEEKEMNSYWQRRINDGDVTIADKGKKKANLKVVKKEDSDNKD